MGASADHIRELRRWGAPPASRNARAAQCQRKNVWGSHFTEACRCSGCSGQETDLLAVFETATGLRFAVHVEVKHSDDKFKKETQALAYPVRAQCWVTDAPKSVLPHPQPLQYCCDSARKLPEYTKHLRHFESSNLLFEDIERNFRAGRHFLQSPSAYDQARSRHRSESWRTRH